MGTEGSENAETPKGTEPKFTINFPPPDLKLEYLVDDACYNEVSKCSVKTDDLKDVVGAFAFNIYRLRQAAHLPMALSVKATAIANDGTVHYKMDKVEPVRIKYRANPDVYITIDNMWWLQPYVHDEELLRQKLGEAIDGISFTLYWGGGPGILAWLDSIIVDAWTTFETLAGDLWESALNALPNGGRPKGYRYGLASLSGSPNRILRRSGGKTETSQTSDGEQAKLVNLASMRDLTEGEYNLSKSMGTLLRERFKFTTLVGIQEAYSVAFSSDEKDATTDKIDNALASTALESLSIIRNLLVHKSGKADRDYIQRIVRSEKKGRILSAPKLELGEKITFDGKLCANLISAALEQCMNLIRAVDTWLQLTNRPSDSEDV